MSDVKQLPDDVEIGLNALAELLAEVEMGGERASSVLETPRHGEL